MVWQPMLRPANPRRGPLTVGGQWDLLVFLHGTFLLLLLLVTVPLWTGSERFPTVPFFATLRPAPLLLDQILAVLLLGLFVSLPVAIGRGRFRPNGLLGKLVAACAFVLLVVSIGLDQHRLQPWAYLATIHLMLFVIATPTVGRNCLRWIFVSVYFYSAISKMDYTFMIHHGPSMLRPLLGISTHSPAAPVGSQPGAMVQWGLPFLSGGMVVAELLVALLLIARRTRRWGIATAVALHGGLILLLGPWGLAQRAGVLVWNLAFLVLVPVLFLDGQNRDRQGAGEPRQWLARGLTALVVALPLLEPVGFDHWPAWGLYSARASALQLWVTEQGRDRLPEYLRRYCETQPWQGVWYRVRLDRWSLAETKAPLYPEDRFQLGVVIAVVDAFGLDSQLLVRHLHPASRLQGKRQVDIYVKRNELLALADHMWFNARPRRWPLGLAPTEKLVVHGTHDEKMAILGIRSRSKQ